MRILLLAFSVILFGCSTPYQPHGWYRGGYVETRLAPNIYEVTFTGNGYTSMKRAKDYAMLRAAELCLENGYSYISVMSRDNSTELHSYTTQRQSFSTYPAYVNGTYYGNTINVGGDTEIYETPSASITVQMHRNAPASGESFDASFLKKSLKSQYGIE